MNTWQKDELSRITAADDLHIASFREDGVTYGTPTWIWLAVGEALRPFRGQAMPCSISSTPCSRWS